MTKLNIALTIAGTDPTGGAGIMADLKSFQAREVYGMAVVTSVVAQNTLGVQMIRNIAITAGGTKLQEYPGEYLYCMVQRDFNNSKKDLWKKMIGHTPELNDPANANGNINTYPNAAITSPPLLQVRACVTVNGWRQPSHVLGKFGGSKP